MPVVDGRSHGTLTDFAKALAEAQSAMTEASESLAGRNRELVRVIELQAEVARLRSRARVEAERPAIGDQRKPLAITDPIAWWADEARLRGVTIDALFEQITRADDILDEMAAMPTEPQP